MHRYDLKATFDVLVGQEPAERFTVYTDVLTPRSKFLTATRKPEWLAGNTSKPVDLSDEDPDVFQAYLNCVYFGSEALHEHSVEFERQLPASNVDLLVFVGSPNRDEHSLAQCFEEFGFKVQSVRLNSRTDYTCAYDVSFEDAEKATKALADCNQKIIGGRSFFVCGVSAPHDQMGNPARSGLADTGSEALIKLYLLADKLQDFATANIIMDQLIKFVAETGEIPKHGPTSLAYNSSACSNPLRALLRDYWVYHMPTDVADHLKTNNSPKDFLQDVATELMLLKLDKFTTKNVNLIR